MFSSVTETIPVFVARRSDDEGAGFEELADAGAKAVTADKLTATAAAMTTRAPIVVGVGMMTVGQGPRGRGRKSRADNRGKGRERIGWQILKRT